MADRKRENVLAREGAGEFHRSRRIPVDNPASPIAEIAPNNWTRLGPLQDQIVAGPAKVIRNEPIIDPSVGERDFLSLGEVAEGSRNEGETGVVHHGQSGPCGRSEIEARRERLPRSGVTPGGHRDIGSGIEGRHQVGLAGPTEKEDE